MVRSYQLNEEEYINSSFSSGLLLDEIEATRANTRKTEQAIKKLKETRGAELERLENELKSKTVEYEKKKKLIHEKTAEAEGCRDKWREEMSKPAIYEPLLKGLGIDFKTGLCAGENKTEENCLGFVINFYYYLLPLEGKPINASGAEGTCNAWDCPLRSFNANPEKSFEAPDEESSRSDDEDGRGLLDVAAGGAPA